MLRYSAKNQRFSLFILMYKFYLNLPVNKVTLVFSTEIGNDVPLSKQIALQTPYCNKTVTKQSL